LPIKYYGGIKQEKGIDVWLALEAYEMAFYKKFDVLVLISGDGDYVPLIRKLNTLGTAVMVLSWDFEYTGEDGKPYYTRTSQYLLEEVSYPVPMHEIINNRVRRNEAMVNNLFVPPSIIKEKTFKKPVYTPTNPNALLDDDDDDDYYAASNLDKDVFISKVLTVKDGYGFIKNEPDNAFFHYTSLIDYDFNDLVVGDKVQFKLEITDEGKTVAKEIMVLNSQNKQVVYEE
jgi:cold shock CspA family protein